jgi:hypothetical protein
MNRATRRMRRYRALLRGQGTSIGDLYWAGCIINMMSEFDLRQARPSEAGAGSNW